MFCLWILNTMQTLYLLCVSRTVEFYIISASKLQWRKTQCHRKHMSHARIQSERVRFGQSYIVCTFTFRIKRSRVSCLTLQTIILLYFQDYSPSVWRTPPTMVLVLASLPSMSRHWMASFGVQDTNFIYVMKTKHLKQLKND